MQGALAADVMCTHPSQSCDCVLASIQRRWTCTTAVCDMPLCLFRTALCVWVLARLACKHSTLPTEDSPGV